MAFFRLQAVDRQHQRRDIPVGDAQPLRVLLPSGQHRLVPAEVPLDGIVRQLDWLLLDARGVEVPMASNLTFVLLSSLKPLFFTSLTNELCFSVNAGA